MCAEIFVPLLDGLHAAHSLNPPVVHRDLKPDNVFLAKPSHGYRVGIGFTGVG